MTVRASIAFGKRPEPIRDGLDFLDRLSASIARDHPRLPAGHAEGAALAAVHRWARGGGKVSLRARHLARHAVAQLTGSPVVVPSVAQPKGVHR